MNKTLFRKRPETFGVLMITPAIFVLLLVIAFPLAYVLRSSFLRIDRFNPGSPAEFIGFKNFVELLSDETAIVSIVNTFRYVFLAVSIEFIIGTIIALLLSQSLRKISWMRTVFLFPLMTAPIVAGLQWRWLLTDQIGIINNFLTGVLNIADPPLWLADPSIALFSLIMVDVWMNTPFIIIIMYSGIVSIPLEIIESAKVDGASYFQSLRHIYLPFLKPTILVVLLMRMMDSFRVFDTVFILTRGGPGISTQTISMYTYQLAFTNLNFEKAGALSLIATIVLVLLSIVMARILRQNDVI